MHTSPPYSQDNFVCLPPIRPVCFLSPHYKAVRGATALRLLQIYTVVTNVDTYGTSETSMNKEKAGLRQNLIEMVGWAVVSKPITVDQTIFTICHSGNVSDCLQLLGVTTFNDHISQQQRVTAVLFGAHTLLTHIHIPQSDFTPHQTLSTLTPTLPSLRPDIILVCYVFSVHISSAFPFSCSPSAF